MKNEKYSRILCVCLILSVILGLCATGVTAKTDFIEQPRVPVQAETSENESSAAFSTGIVSPEIVDGAIYALLNQGSSLWASTARTAATIDNLNLFQYSTWNNAAQTFQFVKVSETDNTYVIYPLEYNKRNQDVTNKKALWCDCSMMASNPQTLNATLAEYDSSVAGFEWTVEYLSTGFSLRLKDYPNYCLFAIGTTSGSPTATGVSNSGNIVVKYVSPNSIIPSTYRLWELKYVIPNGGYFVKNRSEGLYLSATTAAGSKAILSADSESVHQSWTITHVSNGKYFITSTNSGALAISSSTPVNGDFVYVEGNMAQPRFQWIINRTASGSFKIQCSTAEDYDYALKDGDIITDHHYVASGEYTDDTDYSDEWYISDSKYLYHATHYYDQGYITRFSTEDTTAFELLKHYQDIVSERLYDIFALKVIDTYYTIGASEADICKGFPMQHDKLDDFCNHATDHLSRPMQRSGAPNGNNTKTTIIWTGHLLYEKVNGIITKAYSADSHAAQYKILITPRETTIYHDINQNRIIDDGDYYSNKSASLIEEESVYDLMHETSHQLGLLDHYCTKKTGELGSCSNLGCIKCHDTTNDEGEECVMNKRLDISAIMSDSVYCTVCKNRMKAHLEDHH